MFVVIAQGEEADQRLELPIPSDVILKLGRSDVCDLTVPWDPAISREHASLQAKNESVSVNRFDTAVNPVFHDGHEVTSCGIRPGDRFVIGGTTFHVALMDDDSPSPADVPLEKVTFDPQALRHVRFRDADRRIDVLARLPEVIRGSNVDSEFHVRLATLLLAGIRGAEAVAIVEENVDGSAASMHWERRTETAGDFRPSSRLIAEAIGQRRSVLHVWEAHGESEADYTQTAEFDWAFCTPLPEGDPWGLYVAGKSESLESVEAEGGSPLQGDVKFTEIVAEVVSSVRRQNRLERQQAGLRQFFAPPVLAALGDDLNTDLLEPSECDVTVLFCDLRGFSSTAEASGDQLMKLLDRVSRALEVMTEHILQHGGVTGDFQGDSALGFWGWPFQSDDAPIKACRAALGIRADFDAFRGRSDHPLADFQMGIGIAHGRAVAGKIGTREHVKPTVFGPVVNLASRLESMTKQLHVPILVDEALSAIVRERLCSSEGRLRKLARVLPYGMETPVYVSELLPSASGSSELSDEHVAEFERGVERFIEGDWEQAWQSLHQMPASDRAQDFLSMLITRHNRTAPPDWDGVMRLQEK